MPTPTAILGSGLWWNNPGLAQLLGLCPLLAVSRTAAAGIGLGLASLAVITLSNGLVSAARRWLYPQVRLPALVLIIAALVTCVDLAFQAFQYELYQSVGLFLPLIVTNCVILARAEAFASKNSVGVSLLDGLAQGAGFALVLAVLGALREWLGNAGLLVAILPPGAFFLLAGLVAAGNAVKNARRNGSQPAAGAVSR
jgi:Na+-translocating ferredoxin:NAD+ oxidoreductase subunit E